MGKKLIIGADKLEEIRDLLPDLVIGADKAFYEQRIRIVKDEGGTEVLCCSDYMTPYQIVERMEHLKTKIIKLVFESELIETGDK